MLRAKALFLFWILVASAFSYILLSVIPSFTSLANAEDRVKVAVVDTGIVMDDEIYPYLCHEGHRDLTNTGIVDRRGHGSMIAHVITQKLDPTEYCLIILKWYNLGGGNPTLAAEAISQANTQNAHIINLSLSGTGAKQGEAIAIKEAIVRGAVVVVAAGNDHIDLSQDCDTFPACYPYTTPLFHIVADYLTGNKSPYTNYGGPVTDTEDGRVIYQGRYWDGTSVSAAKVTNRILRQHGYLKDRK